MPWQTAPSLLIIFGAFNAAAGLIWTVDRCYYGKVRIYFLFFGFHYVLLAMGQ